MKQFSLSHFASHIQFDPPLKTDAVIFVNKKTICNIYYNIYLEAMIIVLQIVQKFTSISRIGTEKHMLDITDYLRRVLQGFCCVKCCNYGQSSCFKEAHRNHLFFIDELLVPLS